MTSVVFYFQVHQPYRLKRFTHFDVGQGLPLFDDAENERILRRVAERSYIPTNKILLDQIEATDGQFRCAFSLSGTVLEQFERWCPEALESFQALVATGAVELLCETSQHSMASEGDRDEWRAQIEKHRATLKRLFDVEPVTFRNTELVLDESIAREVEAMGFETLMGEGADDLLEEIGSGRGARYVWRPHGCDKLRLLLRDYVLSDDIAFRFSNAEWPEFPLFANVYAEKLASVAERGADFVGLFMDYETFGEHQVAETGILDFLEYLPQYVLEQEQLDFATPREVSQRCEPAGDLVIHRSFSWADAERDLSAWLGNPMQTAAHEALYSRADEVRAAAQEHPELLDEWRKLTTSDHVYYMCTKKDASGEVHDYFSPYGTPHDAFITFMNALDDLWARLDGRAPRVEIPDVVPAPIKPPKAPASKPPKADSKPKKKRKRRKGRA